MGSKARDPAGRCSGQVELPLDISRTSLAVLALAAGNADGHIWKIQGDGGQVHDPTETSLSSNLPGWGRKLMVGGGGGGGGEQWLNKPRLYGQPDGSLNLFFTTCVLG